MFWVTTILIIIILIFFNALYVASEFSTVSSRRSRLSHQIKEGNRLAETILRIVENPQRLDSYVATCQVGITISSLVLGFYGQGQLSNSIAPIFASLGNLSHPVAQSISVTIILIVLSIFQILLGELVPKNIGIQYPEQLAIATAIPMRWSEIIFKPLIWLFNGSGILIMQLLKLDPSTEHSHIHSPEEIALLIEESGEGGALKTEEHRLLANTLKMRESTIRHVMIPRSRMLTAPITISPQQLLSLVADSPYSRIPIFEEDVDKILGVIHLRDLLCLQYHGEIQSIRNIIYPVPFLPESMLVKEAFSLLQKKRFQAAIVLDEYGGTLGLVTLEDILEQIFGDLKDEFDSEAPKFQLLPGNQIWLRGDMLIEQVNDLLNLDLPNEDIDTIGGLILSEIGYVPIANDEVTISNIKFRVEKMSGRGVAIVSYSATPELIQAINENFP